MHGQSRAGAACGAALVMALVTACGGGGPSTPTGPSGSTTPPTTTAPGGGGGTAVTLQTAAPLAAREFGSFVMTGLREVSSQAPALDRSGPQAVTYVSTYRTACPGGGEREISNLPANLPLVAQVDLTGARVSYRQCSFGSQSVPLTANGTLNLRGTYWKAERPDQDVRLQGPITLSPLAGDQQVDGRILPDGSYTGSITGVNVITGPTVPPPPAPPSTGQLLAGNWQGRAIFSCSVSVPNLPEASFSCTWTYNLALQLTGNGSALGGTAAFTVIGASGGNPACAASVGQTFRGPVNGSAANGRVDLGASGLTGEYNAGGSWMGGRVTDVSLSEQGINVRCGGDWQAIR